MSNERDTAVPYVLVVEDDGRAATSLRAFLSHYIEVELARTANSGWAHLTSARPPAGIIMDEGLPGELGTRMLARYRRRFGYGVPAIVISGSARADLGVDVRKLHARYVPKGSVPMVNDLARFGAAIAVRPELQRLILDWAPREAHAPALREVLDVVPWVPRDELSDALGIDVSAARKRLTRLFRVLPVSTYDELRAHLDPLAIFAARAGGHVSGTHLRIASMTDLAVLPDDGEPIARRRPPRG